MIYKDDHKNRFKHFELIKYLHGLYTKEMEREINNLKKLSNNKIKDMVCRIPKGLLTEKHREYIIKYLIKRKEILMSII